MAGKGRQFPKGVSGNPGGVPKVAAELKRQIVARLATPDELVAFAFRVYRGQEEDMQDSRSRLLAFEWLSDRLYGKASQVVELLPEEDAQSPAQQLRARIASLSTEQRAALAVAISILEPSAPRPEPVEDPALPPGDS